jgi:hypothetical protein
MCAALAARCQADPNCDVRYDTAALKLVTSPAGEAILGVLDWNGDYHDAGTDGVVVVCAVRHFLPNPRHAARSDWDIPLFLLFGSRRPMRGNTFAPGCQLVAADSDRRGVPAGVPSTRLLTDRATTAPCAWGRAERSADSARGGGRLRPVRAPWPNMNVLWRRRCGSLVISAPCFVTSQIHNQFGRQAALRVLR